MSTTDTTIFGNRADAPASPARTDERATRKQEWWRFVARPVFLASGFSVLTIISVASIIFVAITKSNSELVTHTLEVENQVSSLRGLIRDAESGERGYLLSGEPAYLKDFRDAAEMIMPAFADLNQMTADNPVQQQAVAELAPLLAQRIDKMHEVIRLYDTGNAAAAVALVRTGRGRVSMEDIRTIIARMTDEEHRLLALRTSNASRGNFLLLIVNLTGIALMIAFASVSIVTVRRMGEEALRDSEKRGDELQAAVNDLDAFSYSVSHDLRTPLRSIDGFSRILLKHHAAELAPEPREYLQAVRDNAAQMGHLVDDLLAFARLNRKQLSKQRVPTKPIVEDIVRAAQQLADGRCVNVSVGDLPAVWGDSALLKQVFVNLIDNAFKYTRPRADATVEIGAREIGGEQVFFVRDNGVGFDMTYAGQLFGVFQRLHRAEDFEGTGVGLAIVQRIVERHGGRVWAEAAVNQGATFYFTTEVPVHA